jgi:chromosome segregation ATPase
VQALVEHAQAQATSKDSASTEELEEMRAQLKDARDELRKARLRMEEAEDLSRQFKVKLQAAENRANALEEELGATKTLLATAEAKLVEAEHALSKLRAEYAALQEAHTKLQILSEQQKAKIEKLSDELRKEQQENEKLRAEVERLQEYVRRAEQLERELKALQAKFQELEAEAEAMRQELARRNNTRTKGTQTNLTGSKLDEQAAETRKLKLMLEELQNKMKEFMQEVRRKYGAETSSIVDELGLKDLLKEETVFQRLYDDAMERVQRLEKLRSRVRKERKELWPIGGSPRAVAADVCERPEIPILQAIDENQPTEGMRRLIQEKQPLPQNATTKVRAQRDQGCGGDTPMQGGYQRPPDSPKAAPFIMKTSTSLPSLSKAPPNLAMVQLNLEGAGRSAPKRRHLF